MSHNKGGTKAVKKTGVAIGRIGIKPPTSKASFKIYKQEKCQLFQGRGDLENSPRDLLKDMMGTSVVCLCAFFDFLKLGVQCLELLLEGRDLSIFFAHKTSVGVNLCS